MSKTVCYKFNAFGETRYIEVPFDVLGVVYEKGAAMAKANKEMLWSHPNFIADPNGCWFESSANANQFDWMQGNFFD